MTALPEYIVNAGYEFTVALIFVSIYFYSFHLAFTAAAKIDI